MVLFLGKTSSIWLSNNTSLTLNSGEKNKLNIIFNMMN